MTSFVVLGHIFAKKCFFFLCKSGGFYVFLTVFSAFLNAVTETLHMYVNQIG